MAKNGPGGQGKRKGRAEAGDRPDPDNATVLQKRQLVALIAQRVGRRNAEVREIVEATLAELGEAISAGQTLALPPLGRARISKQKDVSGSEVIVLRLRRRKSGADADAGHDHDEND
ncbi:HU family DNA-binding protein [Paracoccus litorisediminis]|uniref:DNA-binding protein n=1 Tax=Paracoccus litorisediminis TaxID=2006130 RepID=A0A844HG05_9RHOB|nr:HU family DNA-binding protein [Paracoccus litorisediminis]MTH57709.1 DNA-binding protein [Paracoccus litorisediminis]